MRRTGLKDKELSYPKGEVLDILKKNRGEHREIIEEARVGCMKQALVGLEKQARKVENAIKQGKMITVGVRINPPGDYTEAYDLVIQQLELCVEDEIKLDGEEVRCLIMDKWDWQTAFLNESAKYSHLANTKLGGE